MQLLQIQHYIKAYTAWLRQQKFHPNEYVWEAQLQFQSNWDTDAPDFAKMYDSSFQSNTTRRLWQTEHWYPKKMMLEFIKMDAPTLKNEFNHLHNETVAEEIRIGRFLFLCDEMLKDYKRLHSTTVENNHYHDDYSMIALYLAFRYPDRYAPYQLKPFQATLSKLGAREIPQEHDIFRYFKVMRTLYTFLEKDGEVLKVLQSKLNSKKHFTGKSLVVVWDFCGWVGGKG